MRRARIEFGSGLRGGRNWREHQSPAVAGIISEWAVVLSLSSGSWSCMTSLRRIRIAGPQPGIAKDTGIRKLSWSPAERAPVTCRTCPVKS